MASWYWNIPVTVQKDQQFFVLGGSGNAVNLYFPNESVLNAMNLYFLAEMLVTLGLSEAVKWNSVNELVLHYFLMAMEC